MCEVGILILRSIQADITPLLFGLSLCLSFHQFLFICSALIASLLIVPLLNGAEDGWCTTRGGMTMALHKCSRSSAL